ncbi:MAG: hypothetical protein ACKV2T_11355 [Kofleriaceae bacterium]
MRALLPIALLLCATSAHANTWLAGDARTITTITPTRPYVRPILSDRWSITAQSGVGWLQIDGVTNEASALIAPAITRTFDRVELAAEYLAMDWYTPSGMRSGGTVHRLGGELRVQVARARVERKMTLDAVATAGIGWQHVVQDHGAPIDRGDISLGVVLRMITDLHDDDNKRILFGFELGARLLFTSGGDDRGAIISFGVPLGW